MASGIVAARAYARALFEASTEQNTVDETLSNVLYFRDSVTSDAGFKKLISSHQINEGEKIKLANEILTAMQAQGLFASFVRLLIERKRISLYSDVAFAFQSFVDEKNNTLRGTVSTSDVLTAEQVAELEKAFGKKLKKTVKLTTKVDPALLGGLVVKIGDRTFDGSLKTALVNIKNSLERQYV